MSRMLPIFSFWYELCLHLQAAFWSKRHRSSQTFICSDMIVWKKFSPLLAACNRGLILTPSDSFPDYVTFLFLFLFLFLFFWAVSRKQNLSLWFVGVIDWPISLYIMSEYQRNIYLYTKSTKTISSINI